MLRCVCLRLFDTGLRSEELAGQAKRQDGKGGSSEGSEGSGILIIEHIFGKGGGGAGSGGRDPGSGGRDPGRGGGEKRIRSD